MCPYTRLEKHLEAATTNDISFTADYGCPETHKCPCLYVQAWFPDGVRVSATFHPDGNIVDESDGIEVWRDDGYGGYDHIPHDVQESRIDTFLSIVRSVWADFPAAVDAAIAAIPQL